MQIMSFYMGGIRRKSFSPYIGLIPPSDAFFPADMNTWLEYIGINKGLLQRSSNSMRSATESFIKTHCTCSDTYETE